MSIDKSLIDAAVKLLEVEKKPFNLYVLFDELTKDYDLTDEQKTDYLTKFYTDLTISAKFVYIGDNEWDLKANQKIELWEKDGSFYKEYTKVVLPDEYKEQPKVVKPKEEVIVVKDEPVVEATPVVEKPVVEEKSVVETTPVVEPVVKDENKTVQDAIDAYEEEVFEDYEDFDEDKYNEYMDTYEDQYDD